MPSFYEFFAGGGMARAGLGPGWTCLMANDVDPAKASAYRANWGAAGELPVGDVGRVALLSSMCADARRAPLPTRARRGVVAAHAAGGGGVVGGPGPPRAGRSPVIAVAADPEHGGASLPKAAEATIDASVQCFKKSR